MQHPFGPRVSWSVSPNCQTWIYSKPQFKCTRNGSNILYIAQGPFRTPLLLSPISQTQILLKRIDVIGMCKIQLFSGCLSCPETFVLHFLKTSARTPQFNIYVADKSAAGPWFPANLAPQFMRMHFLPLVKQQTIDRPTTNWTTHSIQAATLDSSIDQFIYQ